jgi:hypothetical protein
MIACTIRRIMYANTRKVYQRRCGALGRRVPQIDGRNNEAPLAGGLVV